MRSTLKSSIVSPLIVLLLSLMPLATLAQDASTPEDSGSASTVLIAIYPKDKADGERFEAEVNPGEEVTLTAVLVNHGTEPISLRTYSSGIVPLSGGGLRIAGREAEQTGPALWMTYPEEEMEFQPQQTVEQPLVIKVPEGTPPGQYVTAVVLETVDPVNDSGTSSFEQYFRKIVSVYINVPGEVVSEFTVGEPEVVVVQGLSGMILPISNTGNIRLDLFGEATLTSSDGSVVHSGEIVLGPIYMGQEVETQIPFALVPPPGEYQLSYTLQDRESGYTQSSEAITVVVPEDEFAEAQPISFDNVLVEPNADPIVFANVTVDVTIAQANYRSTRLTLSVFRDGELVEAFVLAENLSLSQGTTTVSQRYLPATGFEPGTYTFSLKLDSTDGSATSMLYEEKDVATLEVP